jgi:hypothetical protein
MQLLAILMLAILNSAPQSGPPGQAQNAAAGDLEKSAYFAFVGRDYILTVEVVEPGIPLLNFVSMAEEAKALSAKQIRIRLENRTAVTRFFLVETGNPKDPITAPSVNMRPRSSFGVRIQGDFGDAKVLWGVTIRVGEEDFKLAPLSSLVFENLVLKVNRINLGSPDFRDDWQALKLEVIGTRGPASRRID